MAAGCLVPSGLGTSSVRYQAGSPRVAMDVLIVWSTLIRQYLGH